jgi:uncharacterized membrane protein YsdA (DUF1294 family)
MIAAALLGHLPTAVAALYLGASALAYLLYGIDKSAARRGARRTPESTLLVIGLLGGWPGALVAQNRLRHKNKKATFLFAFWITVILNGAALLVFLSVAH